MHHNHKVVKFWDFWIPGIKSLIAEWKFTRLKNSLLPNFIARGVSGGRVLLTCTKCEDTSYPLITELTKTGETGKLDYKCYCNLK